MSQVPSRRLLVEADGGSRGNPGPAGYGATVRDADTGRLLAERAGYLGVVTNNVAEYSGLVAGLEAAREVAPGAAVEVLMDSRLVVEQMSGRWKTKHEDMRRLAEKARAVLPADEVRYTWVPRLENSAADALANEAMDTRGSVSRDFPDDDVEVDEPDREVQASSDPPSGDGDDVPDPAGAPTPSLRQRRPSGAAMRFDDAEPVTVALVRHGETAMTKGKALSGSSVAGPPLDRSGRIQAAHAADLAFRIGRRIWLDLPHPSALVASPMVRTQETAAAIGRRLGLSVQVDDAFAESDFGRWEGLTVEAVERDWPGDLRRWYEDPDFPAPDGESLADVGLRVADGLQRLLDGGVGRTVVVASHAMAIRAAAGVTLGMPAATWAWLRILPASVTVLRWWADGTREAVVLGMPTDV